MTMEEKSHALLPGNGEQSSQGGISRREFVRLMILLAASTGAANSLAACAAPPPTAAPSNAAATAAPSPAATSAPTMAPTSASKTIQSLRVAGGEEPPNLDPHNMSLMAAGQIGLAVTPGLTFWDFDGKIAPLLAESWQVSTDGLTYTFKLRPNLKFHNGKVLDAKAVVKNFERILDPKTGSFLLGDLGLLKKVEPKDDLNVVFTLSAPYPAFVAVLANRLGITDVDALSITQPIGAGPFRIKEYIKGSHLVLTKFENYWDTGKPKLDEVTWRWIAQDDVALTALKAGEVDLAWHVPWVGLSDLLSKNEIAMDLNPSLVYNYFFFNCQRPPFNDVRVRKAVAYAINKDQIIKTALDGYASEAISPYPPGHTSRVDLPKYEYSPDKAKKLLEEAGFAKGLTADYYVYSTQYFPKVGEIAQAQLKSAGIELKFTQMETATYWAEFYLKGKVPMGFGGYSPRLDPHMEYYPKFHSKGAQNSSQYNNPQVDKLLDEGQTCIDAKRRKEIYDQVQTILNDEVPWLYVLHPKLQHAWKPYVKGYRAHQSDYIVLNETYIQK